MSVYNRKSWYHNGTKHWIHNRRHYHKRMGFFKVRKKYNFGIIEPCLPKKNSKKYIYKKSYGDEMADWIIEQQMKELKCQKI